MTKTIIERIEDYKSQRPQWVLDLWDEDDDHYVERLFSKREEDDDDRN